MVIYYSWSGNTKAYAEMLATKKNLPLFELKEKKGRKIGKLSFIKACAQAIVRKKTEVVSMPDIGNWDEIFVCTPVWASGPAPAVRFFLNQAGLKDKKVNFLFTYGGSEQALFEKQTLEMIKDKGCVTGNMYAFLTKFNQLADSETIKDNINGI